jgi:hypothetical protein
LWTLLMTAFGLKRRNRPWGTVYDSVTKQPLDPAYVVLTDSEGNEINTSITDIDGRYGFLVNPGTYKIVANKTNYIFPSAKLAGKSGDEVYGSLYFGEEITITDAGDVIGKNIPLDPTKFDWNEFAKREEHVMKFYDKRSKIIGEISDVMFAFGFTVAGIALFVAPKPYNIGIFLLYVFLLILKKTGLKQKPRGSVSNSAGYPLSYGILRIYSAGLNKEITHKIINEKGYYYCLIPNGEYFAKIEKKNADESYTEVLTTPPFTVSKGYIDKHFVI